MPHSFGLRAKTRHLFARKFREHGPTKLSTYLKTFKVGDIVDVSANASIHKGMPHKFYQGKTGVVFNVTPHAVGVIVNKRVGNRILKKRINLRIEHVKHSKCRDDFLARVKRNDELKKKAKAEGTIFQVKRQPPAPRPAFHVSAKNNAPVTKYPVAYELLV